MLNIKQLFSEKHSQTNKKSKFDKKVCVLLPGKGEE